MADRKMPSSMGGLVQFNEEHKNGFSITPKQVIIATGILVLIVILLNFINPFGF